MKNKSYEMSATDIEFPVELMRTQDGTVVSADYNVAPDNREELWIMLRDGFMDLNRKSYEKQDMTQDELDADLISDKVLKFIARGADNKPIGFMTLHEGLDDVAWTDTAILAQAQNDVDPDATPYYVGTIVVPPDMRGADTASNILRSTFKMFKQKFDATGKKSLGFFDCAESNFPWLPQHVATLGAPAEDYEGVPLTVTELYVDTWIQTPEATLKVRNPVDSNIHNVLDRQHYFAVDINGQ